jgi:hypothetical protein
VVQACIPAENGQRIMVAEVVTSPKTEGVVKAVRVPADKLKMSHKYNGDAWDTGSLGGVVY